MKKRTIWGWIKRGLLIGLLLFSLFLVNLIWFRPLFINHFYAKVFIEFAWNKPQMMSGMGVGWFNDQLDDNSREAQDRDIELLKKDYRQLLEYDRESLEGQEQLSYDILAFFLEDAIRGLEFDDNAYSMTQRGGSYQGLINFMSDVHDIDDVDDAEDYLSRVSQFGRVMDNEIIDVREEQASGTVPPTFIIDKIIENLHNVRDPELADHPLMKDFNDKIDNLEGLESAEQAQLKTRMAELTETVVNPAYDRLLTLMAELRAVSTNDAGVWKFPNGAEYYQHRIKSMTTTDYTAEQLHQIGLEEVERILTEMAAILESEGYVGKTVGEFMLELNEDPKFLYPDTDEGRGQILADYQSMIDEIDTGMDRAFDIRPKSVVEVRRTPEYREKTAAGGSYSAPAIDGSRPGIFYANLYDIKATPKFGMRTLAYHEAVPGHHFQIAIKTELEGLPMFRNFIGFTAYSEGWALYAERLAWELGYQTDPYDNLGRLQAELMRAVRLVVDTGLHHKRWTREQAIDYMASTTGQTMSDVESEIERYVVWPGQALAYKVGMMKILELREKAERELGDRYDIRDFHNVVLKNGAVPLTILERLVDEYIEDSRKAG